MAGSPRSFAGWLKRRILPRSLLGRSLLMILLPLVLLQAVALFLFYGSHLDVVSRRLSASVAGELAYTLDLMRRFPGADNQAWILASARAQFNLAMTVEPGAILPNHFSAPNILGPMDDDLEAALRERVRLPFTMDWLSEAQSIKIRVQLPEGVLDVDAPRKRLYSATVYLFVLWVVGTALLLFSVAALFMRNQVRAIRRLAAAAEAFGVGRDVGPIKPEGAVEVRQAATAFNRMQDRIRRFLAQRTEMLAGVSHDLRTPLTRLRLALAMVPKTDELRQDVAEMTADVEEMERMIGGYLAFARGEGGIERAARAHHPAARRRREARGDQPCRQCPPARAPRHAGRGDERRPKRAGDGGRRRPRHPAGPAGERVPPVREWCCRRHRARAHHRAGHRPRAWRRHRPGG